MASESGLGAAVEPVDTSLELESFEREYNLRLRHPEREAVYAGFSARSAALREGGELRFSSHRYGDSPNACIDLFRGPPAGASPLLVFIHGGYWRALDRSIFSFLARPWVERGFSVALPGYDLVPHRSVAGIVEQVCSAFRWLEQEAPALGLDLQRCVVSGHSAGAQLGLMALLRSRGWVARGFAGLSGVYDLRPLRHTRLNRELRLDEAQAAALSPAAWAPALAGAGQGVRCLCAVGGLETEGFRWQTRHYASRLQQGGHDTRYLEVAGRTHFDILDDLAEPDSELFLRTLALWGGTSGDTPT